jgi:HK97 family phage prohead protease
MLFARGATLLNSKEAKSVFAQSPLAHKRIDIPLRVEIDNVATKAARDKDPERRVTVLRGYASTKSIDAHKHAIPPATWKKDRALARYVKNPVVLYQHNPEFVVGTADEAKPDTEGLYVELSIAGRARITTGEELGDLLEDGRLRTLSVGIRVIDYEVTEVEGEYFATLTDIELLEISIVSIPANEDAIFEVVKELSEYVTKSLGSAESSGGKMDRKLICKSLGLPEDASDLDILAAMNRTLTLAGSAKSIRRSLGLPEDAPESLVEKTLAERDPAKLVELTEFRKRAEAKDLVAQYAKKIDPALREWAEDYALKDPDGFKKWGTNAADAVTADAGRQLVPSGGDRVTSTTSSKTISQEDREICEKFGAFETAEEMEKLAATTPADALGWIFKGRRFALTNADKDTMRRREAIEKIA